MRATAILPDFSLLTVECQHYSSIYKVKGCASYSSTPARKTLTSPVMHRTECSRDAGLSPLLSNVRVYYQVQVGETSLNTFFITTKKTAAVCLQCGTTGTYMMLTSRRSPSQRNIGGSLSTLPHLTARSITDTVEERWSWTLSLFYFRSL